LKNNNIYVNKLVLHKDYVISHESLFLENMFLIHTNPKADTLFVCLFVCLAKTNDQQLGGYGRRFLYVACHVSRVALTTRRLESRVDLSAMIRTFWVELF